MKSFLASFVFLVFSAGSADAAISDWVLLVRDEAGISKMTGSCFPTSGGSDLNFNCYETIQFNDHPGIWERPSIGFLSLSVNSRHFGTCRIITQSLPQTQVMGSMTADCFQLFDDAVFSGGFE